MRLSSPPAILLSGQSISVSAARSLGRAGVEVHAIGDVRWEPVRASRYCASFTDAGGPENRVQRYRQCLRDVAARGVILPCDDDGLELVARHRDELTALGHTPVEANDEVVLAMLD